MNLMRSRAMPSLKFAAPLLCGANFIPIAIVVSRRGSLAIAYVEENFCFAEYFYRNANKGLHILLSRTQAGPGRTVKKQQEDISRNHVQTFIYASVILCRES